MTDFNSIFFIVFLLGFILATEKLWKLHGMGANLYFNYVYKPNRLKRKGVNLERSFKIYQLILWVVEVITAIGTVVTLAVMLKA